MALTMQGSTAAPTQHGLYRNKRTEALGLEGLSDQAARRPSHLQRSLPSTAESKGPFSCACVRPHAALLPAAQRWRAHP